MNNDVEIHVVDLERILLTEIHRDSFEFSCLAVVDVTSELRGHHMGLRCVEAAVVHARHLLCARYGARRELEEARNVVKHSEGHCGEDVDRAGPVVNQLRVEDLVL